MRDPFPAWSGKKSGRSRRISRGGDLHRKGERNSRVVPPFPESPRCLIPFQENLFFPAMPRVSSRGSTHTTVACGTALWESLVGKPRGKATDPLIHGKGSPTLLLQLGRKATFMPLLETRTDSLGQTPEVPQVPCQHWRVILRIRDRLHTRS